MPSENWKNNLGGALLNYAQGTGAWDSVQTAFVDGWAEEYAAAKRIKKTFHRIADKKGCEIEKKIKQPANEHTGAG